MGLTTKLRRLSAARWDALRENPGSIFELRRERTQWLDIDKAWDGILFLISEERRERWEAMAPDPSLYETWAIMPPHLLDAGDGLVRYASPRDVPLIVEALDPIDDDALRAAFDPATMHEADVYPDIWYDDDEALEYLTSNFARVRALYRQAAKEGDGVIVVID